LETIFANLFDGPNFDSAIGRYGAKVQIAIDIVLLPLDLPHRIRVLATDGLEHKVLVALETIPHVEHTNCAVTEAGGEQPRILVVKVQAHAAACCFNECLVKRGVLEREEQYKAGVSLEKVPFKNCMTISFTLS
jgi:hypothetical protein